ncbi:MAG TPA: peptidyl-dipeptidase Dcp [Steroidobacteraceae bacterium]|nr:peptidyl-dipeptidase Dcp [Steroidobacteraceae bacterium]
MSAVGAGALAPQSEAANHAAPPFDSQNPFHAPSTLPFGAPPFDRIRDSDYQPAIEAGMAQQLAEVQAIVHDPRPPTFDNTLVPLERSGVLLDRAQRAFNAVTGANIDPELQRAKTALAPKLAAHRDAIYLDPKLFERVQRVYERRHELNLTPEALRLVEVTHDDFVHAGAQLSSADRQRLTAFNTEASTLSDAFTTRLLAANKEGAYFTASEAALAGLSSEQLAAARSAARGRHQTGYLIPLQNTTQQPLLASLTVRDTRRALYERSWNRAELGDGNDTRSIIARLAQLRARRAALLGYPNHAAWKLADQMAKTPQTAQHFMEALKPYATARAQREAQDIQALIDAEHGGFTLEAYDWELYQERVRQARFQLTDAEVKPYFELERVLESGVFYAAHLLYGISFKERKDIPVYQPDVRVFDVADSDGKPLALFYVDYFKRDNKNGGAWMAELVEQSHLLGTRPVIYNVANFQKPAEGDPALISFDDVVTMFHEFGHALHGMFSDADYPRLAGTSTARDFVEFPSQFNEHWALYPEVFEHYARHHATGAPMPAELVEKIKRARNFNEGYALTELLAAAELDMQWHTLPASAPLEDPDAFESRALAKLHLDLEAVPPRYRSSYFAHIWGSGYSAGYYAYLWTQMLADDAYEWFEEHGGLTRANGDRFRQRVLSRGNTQDLDAMYVAWRGRAPSIEAMMKYRGLK